MGNTNGRLRVAIVGMGAIGTVVAAHLHRAGRCDLTLCARRAAPSYRLETSAGVLTVPFPALTDPAAASAVDWILLATKAHQTEDAAPWLSALAGRETRVAILQNGVEHRARVAPYVPEERLLPVVVQIPAERTGEGVVALRGDARLLVPAGPDGAAFAGLLEGSGVRVDPTADFTTAAWRKLCANSLGALMAICSEPVGILRREDLAELARGMVRETVLVARAEGARLDETVADEIVRAYQAMDPAAGTSILADRRAGRPMEWDARNGVVVRKAAAHGIAAPLNAAVLAMLRAISPRAT